MGKGLHQGMHNFGIKNIRGNIEARQKGVCRYEKTITIF